MTTFLINPGSGPVQHATAQQAEANMQAFLCELLSLGHIEFSLEPVRYLHGQHHPEDDPERTGRWHFVLKANGREVEIEMPGAPADRVILRKGQTGPGHNPFNFYRLYVDGSSWLWEFAVEMAREILLGVEEEA